MTGGERAYYHSQSKQQSETAAAICFLAFLLLLAGAELAQLLQLALLP